MKRSKIAFDIDGVVADLFPLISHFMRERYSVIHSPNMQTSFSFEETTGLKSNEINTCIDSAIMNYMSYKPYYGAIPFLKKYCKYSKRPLLFITSRSNRQEIARATQDWLHLYLKRTPFHVHFSNNKIEACKEMEIDTFVEDRAQTAKEMACAGISIILMDRPWNRHVPEDTWNLVRFNDWQEIEKGIETENIKLIEYRRT